MTRKVIVIICAVLALVIGGFAVADELRGTGQGKQQEEETDSEEAETVSPDAEVKSGLSKAQQKVQKQIEASYDVQKQQEIAEELDAKKAAKEYTFGDMLMEYNPFGTNTQSLYVYFETEEPVNISYNIHVSDPDIGDFRRDVFQEEMYATEHEFQVIGLIPDMDNTITFYMTGEDGATDTREVVYSMGSLLGQRRWCWTGN